MRRKFTLRLLFCMLFFFSKMIVFAQVTEKEEKLRAMKTDSLTGWKHGGILVLNLSQASLSNWAAGGENSLSFNGLTSIFLNFHQKDYFWDNSLDLGYGILKQGKHSPSQKTDDKIDFLSQYGLKASNHLYYAVLFNFKTQFAPGYTYPNDSVKISNFFAPAYLIGAIGMDYKPDNYVSIFFAPVTLKMTFVHDQQLANAGAFGVKKAEYDSLGRITRMGENSKTAFGGYLRFIYTRNNFKSEVLKNVSFTTKLDLFSDYLDKPQNIVINWENLVAFRINRFIAVNINTQLIYDDNIVITEKLSDGTRVTMGPDIQFKEILGIGLSYKF